MAPTEQKLDYFCILFGTDRCQSLPFGPWIPSGPCKPIGPCNPSLPSLPFLPSIPGNPSFPTWHFQNRNQSITLNCGRKQRKIYHPFLVFHQRQLVQEHLQVNRIQQNESQIRKTFHEFIKCCKLLQNFVCCSRQHQHQKRLF